MVVGMVDLDVVMKGPDEEILGHHASGLDVEEVIGIGHRAAGDFGAGSVWVLANGTALEVGHVDSLEVSDLFTLTRGTASGWTVERPDDDRELEVVVPAVFSGRMSAITGSYRTRICWAN
jgi:hypothetical protein